MYACPYCKHQALVGTPEPQASMPPQQQGPTFIVIQGPDHHQDYDHHAAHQASMAHVATARNMSWLVWVIMVVVFSLGGAGAGISRCTKHSAIMSGLVWDGTEPLHCGGVENISVTGVEATFAAGTAIVATANCQVKCTDCKITAPIAIEASGNAQVTMLNGSVKGTSILADASGNARVTIGGNVTVSGLTRASANAKVSAPTPPPTAEPPPTAATTAPPTVTAPKAAATGAAAATAKTTATAKTPAPTPKASASAKR